MTRKFKKGQRVQITEGYVGNPTGEIVKYNEELHAYNVKGDNGQNYNCITEDSLVLLSDKEVEEVILAEEQEKHIPAFYNRIEELEEAVQSGEEVTLSNLQIVQLLAEIQYIREDRESAYATLNKIQMALDTLRERPRI